MSAGADTGADVFGIGLLSCEAPIVEFPVELRGELGDAIGQQLLGMTTRRRFITLGTSNRWSSRTFSIWCMTGSSPAAMSGCSSMKPGPVGELRSTRSCS